MASARRVDDERRPVAPELCPAGVLDRPRTCLRDAGNDMAGNLLPRVGQKRAVAKDGNIILAEERSHSLWFIIAFIAFVSYRTTGRIILSDASKDSPFAQEGTETRVVTGLQLKLTRSPPVEYWFC
jgi:hypothetical protein